MLQIIKHFRVKNKAGRNNSGRITVRHKGAGHKKRFRVLDFVSGVPMCAKVLFTAYDPNRSAPIALCSYGSHSFYKIFNHVPFRRTNSPPIKNPNSIVVAKLADVHVGDFVFNVPAVLGNSPVFAKAAGAKCKVLKQELLHTVIRLPSQKVVSLNNSICCSLGIAAFAFKNRINVHFKAGRNR